METKVQKLQDRHIEQKRWGWEEWIVNNDMYCGKRLHFTELHGSTSLHFHVSKHETMYVELGCFKITTVNTSTGEHTERILTMGDSIVIPPYTPHRISAIIPPSILIEFSTHHENDDSYRVNP